MRKVSGSNPAFTQPLCFIIANYLLVNGDGNGFSRRWFRLYLSFPLLLVYRLGWPFAIIKLVSNFWLCPGRTPNRYFWFCIWHFFCYGTTCYKVFNTKTLRVLRWQKRTDWMMRKCSAGLLDGYMNDIGSGLFSWVNDEWNLFIQNGSKITSTVISLIKSVPPNRSCLIWHDVDLGAGRLVTTTIVKLMAI